MPKGHHAGKRGVKPRGSARASIDIHVRVTPDEATTIDTARGAEPRAAFVRTAALEKAGTPLREHLAGIARDRRKDG